MKGGRLRLDRDAYAALCRQVFIRDDWRCQLCGRRSNLQAHHLRYRSHQGPDSPANLLTLCADCHRREHHESLARRRYSQDRGSQGAQTG